MPSVQCSDSGQETEHVHFGGCPVPDSVGPDSLIMQSFLETNSRQLLPVTGVVNSSL